MKSSKFAYIIPWITQFSSIGYFHWIITMYIHERKWTFLSRHLWHPAQRTEELEWHFSFCPDSNSKSYLPLKWLAFSTKICSCGRLTDNGDESIQKSLFLSTRHRRHALIFSRKTLFCSVNQISWIEFYVEFKGFFSRQESGNFFNFDSKKLRYDRISSFTELSDCLKTIAASDLNFEMFNFDSI